MALFAARMRTANDFGHGVGFVEGLGAGETQYVFAPALRLYDTLAATGGVNVRVGVKHAFQTALKASLGHAVQQVPGRGNVNAFALELGGHVIEESRQMPWHIGLHLFESLLLFQQFRADYQPIERAVGMRRA
ncbi:hypothetical protein D9M71_169870 [compost metagenome]